MVRWKETKATENTIQYTVNIHRIILFYECFEEVHALDCDGTNRFIDIIAFKKGSHEAYILDPTIRFEINDRDQARKVDQEKKSIYESCIPFLKEKYTERYGHREFIVQGLLFCVRGTVYKDVFDILHNLGLSKQQLFLLTASIIGDSVGIIHHHIYKT